MEWDKQAVRADISNWPEGKPMNWSKFGWEHNVPGKNAGQVVKDFALQNGINVHALDGSTPNRCTRSSSKKLPGNEISSPCLPTPASISDESNHLVQEGHLVLGEPCVPYTIHKYFAEKGIIHSRKSKCMHAKFPSQQSAKSLLKNTNNSCDSLVTGNWAPVTWRSSGPFTKHAMWGKWSFTSRDEDHTEVPKKQNALSLAWSWHRSGVRNHLGYSPHYIQSSSFHDHSRVPPYTRTEGTFSADWGWDAWGSSDSFGNIISWRSSFS